ncbi:hypothetical protein BO99DRAFT_406370 [Aspergillus violaceofuscus CBS 115571]|uniref:Uncharacterized protein n=1 Tax=Aspergillus violaceofuscus (strain CBS 115571) TaxID=1450538 RepID=A0A2V5GUQ9_ASPV1|nr:hypothetical protein BO99DRAFT_406370 [Aspergillus violaceofuscus CBS 115571]
MTNARNWSGFRSWHGIHKAFETAQAIKTMIFGWLIIADTIRAVGVAFLLLMVER